MDNKPVDIAIEEFKIKMMELINNSGLTLGIIQLILHDMVDKVDMQYNIEFAKLKKQYQEENIK